MPEQERSIILRNIHQLEPKQKLFVLEYLKDYDTERACTASGVPYATAQHWLYDDHPNNTAIMIRAAIDAVMEQRIANSHIDAEYVLYELLDNHRLARQKGNISASNNALNIIAKLASVDAFAAEKVQIEGSEEVAARLQRARKRMNNEQSPPQKPVSFLH